MNINMTKHQHSPVVIQVRYLYVSMLVFFSILFTSLYVAVNNAHAAPVVGFNAGKIIDDAVFANSLSMNATQIQTFLNNKNPNCDTWGTQPSEFGGGTRADWGTARGYPPPYICLKDYSENGSGTAQIIYNIAQQYQINPQVLVVLLQKEQGLVTDEWPLPSQYKTATGYGCPDTAACDSQYFGLTNQLTWAARMYRAILSNNPNWYTPYILGDNYIRWSPNSACGGSTVNIQNRSTQALYNYTPYQPNQSALNAGYGMGDSCGAYGNRNFYLYFTDWFGSTLTGPVWRWSYVSQGVYNDPGYTSRVSSYEPSVQPGGTVYGELKALNTGNQAWDSMTRLVTTVPIGRSSVFYDSSWLSNNRPAIPQESQVSPGAIGTFHFKFLAPQTTGTFREYFNLVADGNTLLNDPGLYYIINVTNSVPARNSVNLSLDKGQSLNKGEYLLSADTDSTLILQQDGNLVLLDGFKQTWSAGTKGLGGSKLILQTDGNLVLYTSDMKPVWASGTDGSAATKLNLQEDGNLVLYTAANGVVWQSSTQHSPTHFNDVTRVIPDGGEMRIGQRIENAERSTMLFFQSDGNVVLYKNNTPLWATGTDGKNGDRLIMQGDGNLVLYDKAMKPIWYSATYNAGSSRLELQGDDNLVIYKANNVANWATYTNR